MAPLSLSAIGAGVLAGAKKMPHVLDGGKFGTDALTSGKFGNSGNGLLPLNATPRSFPSSTSPTTVVGDRNATWMLPWSNAFTTSDAPRYGTCSSLMPVFRLNSSVTMCSELPTPGEP